MPSYGLSCGQNFSPTGLPQSGFLTLPTSHDPIAARCDGSRGRPKGRVMTALGQRFIVARLGGITNSV